MFGHRYVHLLRTEHSTLPFVLRPIASAGHSDVNVPLERFCEPLSIQDEWIRAVLPIGREYGWMTDSSERRATLWVILASATLTVMAGAILGPIVPAIRSSLDVSESLAGPIITTHGALIVLVSPIAGALIDRIGPRRPSIAGLLLYAIGGRAGLFIDSFVPSVSI